MSFYQHQDDARRRTGLLLAYFGLAIALIILAVNGVVYFALQFGGQAPQPFLQWLLTPASLFSAGITLVLMTGVSLLRMADLAGGGDAVARMAGATAIAPDTQDPNERRLLNLTEEMSIASGTPVPRLFVMRQESSINAFVAGSDLHNCVLCVTQGALTQLTRDELQGVIGHEFSHILNGDMRLNVQLIGVLAGILFIGKVGEFLLRSGGHRSYVSSRNNRNQSGGVILGLVLMLIGYIGLFFGRLIKSAISRQREYLADASAVQFTRNPEGIASALYTIDQSAHQGRLVSANAEDLNHMCLAGSVDFWFDQLLASHPPIPKRIEAISPGLTPRLKARFRKRQETMSSGATTGSGAAMPTDSSGFAGTDGTPASADALPSDLGVPLEFDSGAKDKLTSAELNAVKASVGTPADAHVEYAQTLHRSIPALIRNALHDATDAEYIILYLLQQHDTTPKTEQVHQTPLQAALQDLAPRYHLPCLDIALGTLKAESEARREAVVAGVKAQIRADQRITVTEFIYAYLIQRHLLPKQRQPGDKSSVKRYKDALPALITLFRLLAHYGAVTPSIQQQLFRRAIVNFYAVEAVAFPPQLPSPRQLNEALRQLEQLSPLLKQGVVDTCVDMILEDREVGIQEHELLRATCEALTCPMPPILIHAKPSV